MHRLRASSVWYAYEAAASFLWALPFTVTAYYFVTEVGMSPLQLVLVGTVMELSVFLFEVPTGVVADVVSRRLSIVVGNVVMGIAFVVVGAFVDVWPILIGYAIWGLGWTFTSGAMDAWLADEVGGERLTGVYLRGAQVSRSFTVLGMGASVGLALVDLRLPIVLGGIGTIGLAAFYAGWMPETGFRPAARDDRRALGHMVGTARVGGRLVRSRPTLLAILGAAAFVGMWSESVRPALAGPPRRGRRPAVRRRARPRRLVRDPRHHRDARLHRRRGTRREAAPGTPRRHGSRER